MQPEPYPTTGPPQDPWQTTSGNQPVMPGMESLGYTAPPIASKRSNTGLIIAIAVGAVVLLCGGGTALALMNGDKPLVGHQIRFEVTAESGMATLVNWSTLEDSAIENNVVAPWSKQVKLEQKTGLVGVTASATGKVGCKLWVDGKVVDEGSSDAVVNCSTTVG